MKRKRGNKKGKSKKPRIAGASEAPSNVVSVNTEENSGVDEFDNEEHDSGEQAETPSSTGTDQQSKLETVSSGRQRDNTATRLVYGRVKVKIKTSKTLDSQLTSSDAPTQSDTDKSSQQVGTEKQAILSEKMEDSANSVPEIDAGVAANSSKKSGGIKIKSSRGFSSSSISPCSNRDRGGYILSELVKGEKMHKRETPLPKQDSRRNEQELNTALEVIKKIMKMDAAEPFNAPVNPVALGIPDYFDVINTPMDFGTICSNLEKGAKYMNSEDVYKDVQYIWDNCYKYNNKGDYILELMKRVKKNFTKYWIAAGLSMDHSQGAENIQLKDVAPSTHTKMFVKGGPSNNKTKKLHGLKKHKEGCLCAICVMMRRRQEREENARVSEDQTEASDDYLDEEIRAGENSPSGSPYDEYTSSNMGNSPESNLQEKRDETKLEYSGDVYSAPQEKQEEEKKNDMTYGRKLEGEISENLQQAHRSEEDNRDNQIKDLERVGDVPIENQKEGLPLQHEDETAPTKQQKPKSLLDESQKAKMYENMRYLENPVVLELSRTLFSDDDDSPWNGNHSLVRYKGPKRRSSIHAAIASFLS